MTSLGPTVLEVAAAPRGLDVPLAEAVLHDPVDPFEIRAGDVVLGIGVEPGPEVAPLINSLGRVGAAALLLKGATPLDPHLADEAARAGLAVLSVPMGASWAQVLLLTRSALAQAELSATPDVDSVGPVAVGDLFSLADVIAAIVGAPVTIEDRQSRVLAYSSRQEDADDARHQTILGRRVPDRFIRHLQQEGVFRRLFAERKPIFIDKSPELGDLPRLAVAVKAGDEVLGSIWAAVPRQPDPEVERAFGDCANLVALHLLSNRAGSDLERRLEADLAATLLEGRRGAANALTRLALTGESFRVLAVCIQGDARNADIEADRIRLRDVLAAHLSVFRVRAVSTASGGIVYTVMPTSGQEDRSKAHAFRVAEDFVERTAARLRATCLVGIGGPVTTIADIPRSRTEADQALRVLRDNRIGRRVVEIGDVRMQALLLRLRDLADEEPSLRSGPLRVLIEHDAKASTNYVETLNAFFDAFGDAVAAAAALQVHPNTFRYRLRRLQEIAGVRLDDAEQRLALMLQLRLATGGDS